MAKPFLIDSDVFADYLNGTDKAKEVLHHLPDGTFFYSSLTTAELLSGTASHEPKVKEATIALLSLGKEVVVDQQIAASAAELKRKSGLQLADAIIAASAIATKSVLVTRRAKDFKKVEGLTIMQPY